MNKSTVDYSLYLVTDRGLAGERELIDIVTAAISGGVTIVQLREKELPTGKFIQEAKNLKKYLTERNVPLIINDRVDVAMAAEADGVHVGQDDMPCTIARRMLGPDMIIGVSVSTVEEALEAEKNGADYLGISPIWATPTKTDTSPPIGLEGVRKIREVAKIPMVGIGGINVNNAASVIEAGCDGIAVVSAIMAAKDPENATSELLKNVKSAKVDT